MKQEDQIKQLIEQSKMISGSDADARILGDALDHLEKCRQDHYTGSGSGVWRKIMNSKTSKLATAAAIILAVVLGFQFLGGSLKTSVTFAQVIEPILKAETAVLDIVLNDNDPNAPVIHDMIRGSRIRRTMSTMPGEVSIIDLTETRILSLTESKKQAQYISLEGLPSIPNYMDRLKNLILMLQKSPEFKIEDLGVQEVDGREVIGFLAKHLKAEIVLWADADTGLPVRIEQNEGQMTVVCKNMEFDVPMDETLFSMDVPEGYTLQGETALDLLGSTEEDFIEGLRLQSEVFNDGQFPDDVSVDAYVKRAPAIAEKVESMGLTEEEQTEMGMKIARHLLFLRFFKGQGQWTYRGQSVQLGAGETPIFWYQPRNSETYRVIYGDLHVENVAAENLPQ